MLDRIAIAADKSIFKFDHEDLDRFIAQGADIHKTVLMTSFQEMKNIGRVKTKHGLLEVNYNPILPPNTIWLVRRPDIPTQTL
jgi:hypothetical protein